MQTLSKLSHSYSSIKQYDQCPRKYYHMRIAKDVKDEQGEQAAYGEWVHKAFEEFVRDKKPLPTTLAVWGSALEKFLLLETECEKEIVLDENLQPLDDWFHPAAWLRGKIDLMVRLSPGSMLVIDYKTGKRKPDFDQLEMFALFVFTYFPEVEVVMGAFLWTQFPKTGLEDQRVYKRGEADKLWAKHMSRINTIHSSYANDNWPCRPSGLCKWKTGQCAAYNVCPAGGLK